MRGIQYAAACRLITSVSGILDHPLSRMMTVGYASTFPRRFRARAVTKPSPKKTKGVGNAGCWLHPQPRVRNEKAHERSHREFSQVHPAFPHAMVLTVSFVLSPVTGLVCHRRLAGIAPAKLDASVGASGPHDFAVHNAVLSSKRCLRPPHPVPYVRDDRETPL
jgi:hypothetical protein